MAQLPPLNPIERVSSSVMRIIGGNPSQFTLQGTNTYLIFPQASSSQPVHALLVDTGQGHPSWRSSVQQVLAEESSRLRRKVIITRCILTHWHEDHIGGIADLRALVGTDNVVEFLKFPLYDEGLPTRDREASLLKAANGGVDMPVGDLAHEQIVEASGLQLRVVHTPGHTSDHIALMIDSSPDPSEAGSIFTGDAVLGHGTAGFEDLTQYLQSLEKMKSGVFQVTDRPVEAFPGHGAVIRNAVEKIEEYIAHRAMREREVLDILKRPGPDADGWTSMEIVKVIYKAIPEGLLWAAERGVRLILLKLEGDTIAEKTMSGHWRFKKSNL